MALLPDPPTPTMSHGGNSSSSQISLITPSTPSSRGAPQNTIDHPDLFASPDVSAQGPQESDSFTAPSTPFMNHAISPPVPPPKDPQDRSPAVSSSLVNSHTQLVDQESSGSWASSASVAPPPTQSNHYAHSNQSTTMPSPPPPGATIIKPVSSYTFNGSAYIPDSTYQPYLQQQQPPILNYYQTDYSQSVYQDPYQQHQQGYQEASSLPYPQQQQYHHQEYPELGLVNTTEKLDNIDDVDSATEKGSTSSDKQKRLYWIGGVVITILAGVLIGLLVSMKNEDSGNNSNSGSSNSSSENGRGPSGSVISRSASTWSDSPPTGVPVRPTLLNDVVVPLPTGTPVIGPPPTTTTSGGQPPVVNPPVQPTPHEEKTTTTTSAESSKPTSGGGGNSGPRVPTPPLPSLPPKGNCPVLWCEQNYYWWCMNDICPKDGDLKAYVTSIAVRSLHFSR
ncbi:hypothetical protein BG015_011563 [Linnemannia schmuckeri]|uniref:Uncharacterized protein n=1 Tax=Linnemannia schmuckeri TaxID=64567 RepID=A0A9P5RSK2_9FUNG|nr:hypothetical protein BG015_011563 [Linnemannia schmuckeri]